ncbi:nucleotidyl transferase AbiEii/AbiGii toxin family protein [Mixta sp. Marseille-Q2659]|uniref:nucleotidyl transferase AbiEii/AbiGii toxin family protein n=1 Tax=Mixta sp. Marseille-Q2659 TaxID=2736607 RepID=UPI0023B89202|nr:nucleotidyl transferase AbiEii/AbiGii toxin family protein [Mixta sp. Marseille-Q2659]
MTKLFNIPPDEWGDVFKAAEGNHPLGYPAYIIEKDFWVTQTLLAIYNKIAPGFNESSSEPFIFKGGTSLSKCYNLINRMSEDIDLSIALDLLGCERVTKEEGVSRKSRRQKADAIDDIAKEFVRDKLYPNLTSILKAMDHRVIVEISHEKPLDISIYYPKSLTDSDYGGAVQPRVLLETGGLSLNDPTEIRSIQHMLGECIEDLKDDGVEISVVALSPQRTMLEKIFGVHVNLTQNRGRPKYARHLYDIAMLYTSNPDWCKNKTMFLDGVDFSDVHYKTHEESCISAETGPIILVPVDERTREYYRSDWLNMADMFPGGNLPFSFDELIEKIRGIQKEINDSFYDLKNS